MSAEKLLTVREVSSLLNISEKEVIDLAESGTIPAYKIGGVYLRFKKEQVQEYRKSQGSLRPDRTLPKYTLGERLADFLYFNDFYILSVVIILLLLMIILRG